MTTRPLKKAAPGTLQTGPAKKSKVKEGIWIAVLAIGGLGVAVFFASSGDSGPVEPPDPTDVQSVVADLGRAATAHGICYGWELVDSTTPVSVGSNLGVNQPVTDDPTKCAKWVKVRGTYHWYPDSSDSEDYAYYTISSNLSGGSKLDSNAFDRLGAGTSRLLDDPTSAILDAVEALPLLTQEAGLATGSVPEPSPTGSAAPIETGGSDFWRDRWVLLLVTGVLLAGAAVTLVLGIRSSRRIRRGEETDPFAKTAAQP